MQLLGEKGYSLVVLLAQNSGALEYRATNGDLPYLQALTPSAPVLATRQAGNPYAAAASADRLGGLGVEFLVGGTPTRVPSRYILPYELLRNGVIYFLETGERTPDLAWEEI
jgi:hypothetical protein